MSEVIERHMKLLGKTATDKVTGFKGVIDSINFDLYGCIQVSICPKSEKGITIENSRWFDVTRLKKVSVNPVMTLPDFSLGYVAEGKKGAAEKPAKF